MAINIAVVGLGKIARDQHLPAIAAHPAFTLAATVDQAGGGIAGVPHAPSFAALLDLGLKLDAVALCVPTQPRADIARAAIAAGLATLLEKPPAATPGAVATLVAAADAARVPLFASWHSRFAPMVAPARGWLADKRVTGGRISWRESARKWHPGQAWLWQPGGLGVFDPGINGLSILTAILPGPVTVDRARFEIPQGAATPIAARLALSHRGAAIAGDFDFREEQGERWEIAIETDAGPLLLSEGGAALSRAGGATERAPVAEYAGLYARFAELIQAGASDADDAPLRLVADAFLIAEPVTVAPYTP
ncbi:MAG: galactose 1-dehydrogenase [Proteobacteria bacterium SG_bin5]|nr:Gfo/Idh/MocA family oxidoreductase [Sphingomonas sp.]OQW43241.1 MAG: galactose 1-dehydrogenase [Proteobacteria bacterium SG_bin5]